MRRFVILMLLFVLLSAVGCRSSERKKKNLSRFNRETFERRQSYGLNTPGLDEYD